MMFTDLSPHLQRGFEHAQFRQPGFIYFARHLSCPFARRTLRAFARHQDEIQKSGFSLMFIHMSSDADFRELATESGLRNFKSISDPDQEYYVAFNIRLARPEEMRTWQALIRDIFIRYRTRPSSLAGGDVRQMNGLVVIHQDLIHEVFQPQSISDTPNLAEALDHARTIVQVQRS